MDRGSYADQRAKLAESLRELRRARTSSAAAFGQLIGLSQSTISRYETGALIPTTELVGRWCRAAGAGATQRKDLEQLARELATEFTSWRLLHRDSFAGHQLEIRDLEARTRVMRLYQQSLIPGLLQTAEYTRQMLSRWPTGTPATPANLAARVERQAVLYDEAKQFHFVINETALRLRLADEGAMRGQWDRLLVLSSLANVEIRILPPDASVELVPSNTFVMFDDEVVLIETVTAETVVHDPRDIDLYRRTFDAVHKAALTEAESAALLQGLIAAEGAAEVRGTTVHPRQRRH